MWSPPISFVMDARSGVVATTLSLAWAATQKENTIDEKRAHRVRPQNRRLPNPGRSELRRAVCDLIVDGHKIFILNLSLNKEIPVKIYAPHERPKETRPGT